MVCWSQLKVEAERDRDTQRDRDIAKFPGIFFFFLLGSWCYIDILTLAVVGSIHPMKIGHRSNWDLFFLSRELVVQYLPTRPWLEVAFRCGTHNFTGAFWIIFFSPPPKVLLNSAPSALCVYFWRNSSVMFTEVKARDCWFVQSLYIVWSDFTHRSSFWSAPKTLRKAEFILLFPVCRWETYGSEWIHGNDGAR